MGIGGYKGPQHSEAEKAWARNVIANKLNNDIKVTKIIGLKILEEYIATFNRPMQVTGLYTWLRYIQNPNLRKKYTGTQKPKETTAVFGAKYILYINESNICGFETAEEVQEFLKTNLVLSAQKLSIYEKKDITIQYDIKIG